MNTNQTEQLKGLMLRCPEVVSFKHLLRLSERLDLLAEDVNCVNGSPVEIEVSCFSAEFFEGIKDG